MNKFTYTQDHLPQLLKLWKELSIVPHLQAAFQQHVLSSVPGYASLSEETVFIPQQREQIPTNRGLDTRLHFLSEKIVRSGSSASKIRTGDKTWVQGIND